MFPLIQTNGFADGLDTIDNDIEDGLSGFPISENWWDVQEQSSRGILYDEPIQVGPRTSCHCQVSPQLLDYAIYICIYVH